METAGYLTAREAAEALGISLPTLYSYVSRGLIRSEVADERRRTHRYRREDIERLMRRKEQRRNPGQAVQDALHWGAPVLESAITLIDANGFFYRGRDALKLAASSSLEQVAGLIWDTGAPLFEAAPLPFWPQVEAVGRGLTELPAVECFQVLLPVAAAHDVAGYDLRPAAVAQTGARILQLLATIAGGQGWLQADIAGWLQQAWAADNPRAAALLNAALILCADHELNVSSFTARCVASAGATPYQVVQAGLAALQGVKHGRNTERVEAFLREAEAPAGVWAAIAGRLRRGEPVPGFGHPLYPAGDPRGRALLKLAAESLPERPVMALALEAEQAAAELIGEAPNLDFGLVVLARALQLPPGSPMTLFALGRTVGWVGHALEQYRVDRIIRPRARYMGEPPRS